MEKIKEYLKNTKKIHLAILLTLFGIILASIVCYSLATFPPYSETPNNNGFTIIKPYLESGPAIALFVGLLAFIGAIFINFYTTEKNRENILMQLEYDKDLFLRPRNGEATINLMEKIISHYEDFEKKHLWYGKDFEKKYNPPIDYTLEDLIKKRLVFFQKNFDMNSDFYKCFMWVYGESISKEFSKLLKNPKKFVYLNLALKIIIRDWHGNFQDVMKTAANKLSSKKWENIEEKKWAMSYFITFSNERCEIDLKMAYKLLFRDLMIICILLEKELLRILFDEIESTQWEDVCDLFTNDNAGFLEIYKVIYPPVFEKDNIEFFNLKHQDIIFKKSIDEIIDRFLNHLKKHGEKIRKKAENEI